MENNSPYVTTPPETIFFVMAPMPEDYILELCLELALYGRQLTLNLNIGTQPVSITIEDPRFLALVIKEGMNLVISGFSQQLWLQVVLQEHIYGDLKLRCLVM